MPVEPANPAPTQPETCGNYHEIEESELQAVLWVVSDDAETSISAMAAQGARERRVTLRLPAFDAGEDAEHPTAKTIEPFSFGRFPTADTEDISNLGDISMVPLGTSYAGPGGLPLPPPGSTYAPPRRVGRLPTAPTTMEPVEPEDISMVGVPTARTSKRVSTRFAEPALPPGKRKHAVCCCLLSCPLVLAIGFSLMVVYLRYHPHPPRMRVTTATLKNSTALDGGRATNYSLSIQAQIFNPNTELRVVLRYVQLDLYFQGNLVGTQAVWPAPIHEAPGDSVLRSVHLSVNVTQEHDVSSAWQNATNESGGIKPLVELLLVGRFHSQLNFGRRLPFRFWVYPRCTLWLDPLRGGALRQSWC